jgi:hypothetical protein
LPRVRLRVKRLAPRGCVVRALRVRVRPTPADAAVSAKVDGRAATARRVRRTLRVPTRGLSPGRHRLVVRATAPGHRAAVARMRFKRCS